MVKRKDAENGTENGETVNDIGNLFLTRTVCEYTCMCIHVHIRQSADFVAQTTYSRATI